MKLTQDEIFEMARDAGGIDLRNHTGSVPVWIGTSTPEFLEKFAASVATAERELCALTCAAQENIVDQRHPARIEFDPGSVMARQCAAAIRARGGV